MRVVRRIVRAGIVCREEIHVHPLQHLITFVVVILLLYLVKMLPIDGRAKQIIHVVVIIIGIISLPRYLAVF
jgi:hypothetical protein